MNVSLSQLWAIVKNEPLVVLGVVVAAVTATTTQTWQGYATAAAVALMRFVVTGPYTAPAPAAPAQVEQPPSNTP